MHGKLGAWSIGLALCLLTGASQGASVVQWHSTLERAQIVAAHSNRLVLVHFWGNGCPPCAWMDREVFSRPDVAQAIDQGFVAVKVNKDQFPNIARQFGVAAVPTDVIITPQGQVLGVFVGKAPAAEFVNRLTQVAHRAAPPASQNFAHQSPAPASQQPVPNSGYAPQLPVQQPMAPNGGYAMNGPATGMSQPIPPYPQHEVGQSMAAPVTPRYSDQVGSNPHGAAIPVTNPNAVQTGMPVANPNPTQYGIPVANANPSQYGMPTGQGGMLPMGTTPLPANSHSMNPQVAAPGAMAQTPGQPSGQQPAAAPVEGNPPLALEGFCPVSLERSMRDDPEPKWIPGDPRWGLRHEGRTYLFAGPDEQQTFFNNPNLYAPVLSGNDIVLQVEQGRPVPGVREFGARWKNRVYLFSSRESYEKFQANPTFYENEIFRSQPVAGPARMSGQQVGANPNPQYGYR